MPQTITEKILARAAGKEAVVPGEIIDAKIDTLLMHDLTSPDAIKVLRNEFRNGIAEGLRVVIAPDHYIPQKDIASAILYKELMNFYEEHKDNPNIFAYPLGENYGVCHIMLPQEGHALPGDVILGADSHTCTYGALGAFSTGIGSTEAGNVLATGRLWLRVPESLKIYISGNLPKNVMAKDLFLKVVGDIDVDGALYQAMEWTGEAIRRLSTEERMTITNMAIEAGAKSGIVAPDDETYNYLYPRVPQNRRGDLSELCDLKSDPDADYANAISYNASDLVPLVAQPSLPSNVKPADELNDVKIDQAYIGGCTGGKLEDFVSAAEILKGNKVAKGVRLIVVPSTQKIYRKMLDTGLIGLYLDSGAVVSAPTCGACLGGHTGVLAPGEVCISVTNRNFRGRMGHPESSVYLASPLTVAASAITGYITGAPK